jgi:hypothetical protein
MADDQSALDRLRGLLRGLWFSRETQAQQESTISEPVEPILPETDQPVVLPQTPVSLDQPPLPGMLSPVMEEHNLSPQPPAPQQTPSIIGSWFTPDIGASSPNPIGSERISGFPHEPLMSAAEPGATVVIQPWFELCCIGFNPEDGLLEAIVTFRRDVEALADVIIDPKAPRSDYHAGFCDVGVVLSVGFWMERINTTWPANPPSNPNNARWIGQASVRVYNSKQKLDWMGRGYHWLRYSVHLKLSADMAQFIEECNKGMKIALLRCVAALFPPDMSSQQNQQLYVANKDYNGVQTGAIAWSKMTAAVQFPKKPHGIWKVIERGPGDTPDGKNKVFPVHAIQLPNKKILLLGGSGNVYYYNPGDQGDLSNTAGLFDPDTDTIQEGIPVPKIGTTDPRPCHSVNVGTFHDLFCAGHSVLPNGKVLLVGGTELYKQKEPHGGHEPHFPGLKYCTIYNPLNNSWAPAACMPHGRWYPGTLVLGDGRVFVMAGHTDNEDNDRGIHENTDLDIYDPLNNKWNDYPTANPKTGHTDEAGAIGTYPRLHLLPDGSVFNATMNYYGNTKRTERWIPPVPPADNAGQWVTVNNNGDLYSVPHHGYSSVLLPLLPGNYQDPAILAFHGWPDTDAYICNPLRSNPAEREWYSSGRSAQTDYQPKVRYYGNSVILPDATVMFVTGINSDYQPFDRDGVQEVEFYDPNKTSSPRWWKSYDSGLKYPRNYHSNAILLYDGRILICGSNRNTTDGYSTREMSLEIYSPDYLRRGPRPVYSLNTHTIGYGASLQIQLGSDWRWEHINPDRIGLMRCCAVTHGFAYDQRYVGIRAVSSTSSTAQPALTDSTFNIRIPSNQDNPTGRNLLPPGPYMLFILSRTGVPSLADFITIG